MEAETWAASLDTQLVRHTKALALSENLDRITRLTFNAKQRAAIKRWMGQTVSLKRVGE
jgi:hypothetical protein